MVEDTNNGVLKQKMTRKKIYTPILSKIKCSLSLSWKKIAALTKYFPYWCDEEPSFQRQMSGISIHSGEPRVKCLDSSERH